MLVTHHMPPSAAELRTKSLIEERFEMCSLPAEQVWAGKCCLCNLDFLSNCCNPALSSIIAAYSKRREHCLIKYCFSPKSTLSSTVLCGTRHIKTENLKKTSPLTRWRENWTVANKMWKNPPLLTFAIRRILKKVTAKYLWGSHQRMFLDVWVQPFGWLCFWGTHKRSQRKSLLWLRKCQTPLDISFVPT